MKPKILLSRHIDIYRARKKARDIVEGFTSRYWRERGALYAGNWLLKWGADQGLFPACPENPQWPRRVN